MHTLYELVVVRRPRSDEPLFATGRPVTSSRTVFEMFRLWASLLDRECFLTLYLDNKNHPIGTHMVSVGSLSASLVHPREVFKAAILTNAAAIVLIHNHPSGSPVPSAEDRRITTRLREAGELVGITVLDHVIVGDEDFYSFADAGWTHAEVRANGGA